MHSKAFYTFKVGRGYIGNPAISLQKKQILICELGCVRGIMHFIIQSALLDYSFLFLILVCYIRLVYHTSNFQIAAIALTSLVKDTFSLFFSLGFHSRTFTNHRTAGEGRRHFFSSSLPLPPAPHTLRH